MGLIISLIIGGIVGWLAGVLMKTSSQTGVLANVAIGLVGSSLGFFIAGRLGIAASGLMGFAIALAGAVLLIVILSALGFLRRR